MLNYIEKLLYWTSNEHSQTILKHLILSIFYISRPQTNVTIYSVPFIPTQPFTSWWLHVYTPTAQKTRLLLLSDGRQTRRWGSVRACSFFHVATFASIKNQDTISHLAAFIKFHVKKHIWHMYIYNVYMYTMYTINIIYIYYHMTCIRM